MLQGMAVSKPTDEELKEIERLYRVHEELIKESMIKPFEKQSLTTTQLKILSDLEFLFAHPQCSPDVEKKITDVLAEAAEGLAAQSQTEQECKNR
jgi:hypothetical protein